MGIRRTSIPFWMNCLCMVEYARFTLFPLSVQLFLLGHHIALNFIKVEPEETSLDLNL